MPDFALILNGQFKEIRKRDTQPPDIPHKNVVWLPFEIDNPPFDPAAQIKTGPATIVEADRVVRRWTVRDKTAQELDGEVNESKESNLDAARVALVLGFDHENRIRVLEGKAPVTVSQYRAAVKARL